VRWRAQGCWESTLWGRRSTHSDNRSRTAELLNIDRRTLYRMAERFGIDFKEEPRDE
jgi:DNA-binding NtrC family response regulator